MRSIPASHEYCLGELNTIRSGVEGSVDTGFPLMFTCPLALMVSSPSRRDTMKCATKRVDGLDEWHKAGSPIGYTGT